MTMDEWNMKNGKAVVEAKEEDITVIPSEDEVKASSNGVPTRASKDESAGYIGLTLGILSLIFGIFFGGAPWLGVILGIGGIIFSGLEKNKDNQRTKTMALGGITCGILGICVSIFVGVACALVGVAFKILLGIFNFLR